MITAVLYALTFISLSIQATPLRLGSSVTIEVTNQYHDGVIPTAFNIRCSPQTQENCAKAIVSIQVAKDGNNIVNLQTGDSIFYNRLMESSVTAQGHLDGVINKSYLSVTVNEAVKEDSGLYTCKLVYIDENLNYKEDTASSNVTITNQDTQDIIKHLIHKISLLENLVEFKMSNLKTSLVDQETQLGHELTNLKNRLQEQGNELASAKITLEQQGTQLQNHAIEINATKNTTVRFLAVHTRTGTISRGQTLVYSDVIDNNGGGYNGSTGVFTAPVAGYYLLSVSVTPYIDKEIRIELKSSKSGVLSRLFAKDKDTVDYQDTTCVSRLEAGERVWPRVDYASSGAKLWGEYTQDRLNKFYGYLLKMV